MATLTANLTLTGVPATDATAFNAAGATGLTGTTVYAEPIVTTDTFNVTFALTADLPYTGIISGTGTLTKSGTNKLTLSGANTYSGATTISAGEVEITNVTGLGSNASTISLAGTITQNTGANDVTWSSTKTVTLTGNSSLNNISTDATDAGRLYVEGVVAGAANTLSFGGAAATGTSLNIIELSATNTATAGTEWTVNRGLSLTNSGTIAADMQVAGDIRGDGTFSGDVDVNEFGRILPGSTVGSDMTIAGNLTMDSGSEIWVSYDGNTDSDCDTLVLSGTTGTSTIGAANDDVKFYAIALSGTSANLPATAGNDYKIIDCAHTLTTGADATSTLYIDAVDYSQDQVASGTNTPRTNTAQVGAYTLVRVGNDLELDRA